MARLFWLNTGAVELDQGSRFTQIFAEASKLMLIAESILLLHSRLDTWINELPTEILISSHSSPTMFPHTIITNMAYWWLVLQRHSASYQQPMKGNLLPINDSRPFGETSKALCDRAAQEIMLLVDLYKRWHGLQFFPRNMVHVRQDLLSLYAVNDRFK
ncbi:hypothetical protein FRC08_007473 [Ceratobasidium sp. 394]|nr:hypothetical protein FRC08_007473 [Ceratobasidium sp. 394]